MPQKENSSSVGDQHACYLFDLQIGVLFFVQNDLHTKIEEGLRGRKRRPCSGDALIPVCIFSLSLLSVTQSLKSSFVGHFGLQRWPFVASNACALTHTNSRDILDSAYSVALLRFLREQMSSRKHGRTFLQGRHRLLIVKLLNYCRHGIVFPSGFFPSRSHSV